MKTKKLCLTAALIFSFISVFGQDTSYYDNDGARVNSLVSASYFKVTQPDIADRNRETFKTYFTSGQLRSEGIYSDTTEEFDDGVFKKYYANGRLHQDIIYKTGKFNGHLLTYWENGKSKRIDSFRNGIFIMGKCFDSTGRITAHTVFEKVPEFPGGEAGLLHFLSSEIRYPNKARKKGIQGKVIIGFIVNENGTVSHVKIIQSVSNEIDDEAERVVKRMPRWQPGMHDGIDVKVSYELPVMFKLE